jgi:hypothetical protein
MQSARILAGMFVVSCLLTGCEGGGDNTTAPPSESKAAAEAAIQKARPGPMGKGGAPASPSTK